MSKFLGFLLGIAVALVGPAMFGVLAADGGIKLNTKEMALAYGIGALIFWTVLSYFSGAAALGAALTFGAMIYTVHWIPNRMTNFLNDVPGVTTGMIEGIKQYTLNGVVPILAVISLFFAIQLIVQSVQRRRRQRAEAERLQREQDAAQQQEIESTAVYPVAAAPSEYQPDSRFGNNFGNSNYDDLFGDEPEPTPFAPRNQADEQTAQFAGSSLDEDETVLAPTDRDETVTAQADPDETVVASTDRDETVDRSTDRDETAVASTDRDETMLVSTDRDETMLVPAESDDHGSDDETVAERPDLPQAPPPQPPAATAPAATEDTQYQAAPETQAPQAPEPEAPAPRAAATPPQTATPVAPSSQVAPEVGAPVAGSPAASASVAGAVDNGSRDAETEVQVKPQQPPAAPQAQAPQAHAPQAHAPQTQAPQAQAPQAQAPQAQAPQAAPEAAARPLTVEEVGQQYRERMDPPDVDDTGEFQLGAFESSAEHTQPMMDLPGRFRRSARG